MKNLELRAILPVLQGKLVSGDSRHRIKNVAISKYHPIKSYTLLFLTHKQRLKEPRNVGTCIVVASHPETINFYKDLTTVVQVDNVSKAYWRFADFYRSQFSFPVIGVTGTSGKTTTKEMIAWIVSEKKNVVKTILSQNGLARNLPYLLQFNDSIDTAVIEMGVAGPYQLLQTARYFKPTIGIITKIGTDHMEGFKTQEMYFKEKIKMLEAVGDQGTIILNSDDENSRSIDLSKFKGKVIYFGKNKIAHFRTDFTKFNLEREGMDFTLLHKGKRYRCFVPGFGTHNVYNALAALAAVHLTGIPLEEAIERLKTFKHIKSHLEFQTGINGCLIIDDTWNTNPISIEAALEVLKETSPGKRKIAVLGDIAELGEHTIKEHEKIGDLVASHHLDLVITTGKYAEVIGQRAIQLGMNPKHVIHVKNKKQLFEEIKSLANPQSVVLMKTSMRESFSDFMKAVLQK